MAILEGEVGVQGGGGLIRAKCDGQCVPLNWSTNFCSPKEKVRFNLAFHELLQSFGLELTRLCVVLGTWLPLCTPESFSCPIDDIKSVQMLCVMTAEFPQLPPNPDAVYIDQDVR